MNNPVQNDLPNGLPRPAAGLAMTGNTPSGTPEIKISAPTNPETAEIEVLPDSPEISPELQEHVQAVQKGEIELPGPIDVGIHEGQPVSIQPTSPQEPNIILPLTKGEYLDAHKKRSSVSYALSWIKTFTEWIIKKYPGRTLYRSEI